MILYPSGTVLTNGMLLSVIGYDAEYPAYIPQMYFYNDDENLDMASNYTVTEITLNGNDYVAIYE